MNFIRHQFPLLNSNRIWRPAEGTVMRTRLMFLFPLFVILCFADNLPAQQDHVLSKASSAIASPVPRLIKFSGTLLDAQGQPMKSPAGVTFALYARQAGDAALWMETQNVEIDAKGNYSVLLGASSTNGIPAEFFNTAEARWLGVQPEREPELPRVLLVSVPYALKAADAETLGGFPASAFLSAAAQIGALATTAPGVAQVGGVSVVSPQNAAASTVGGTGKANFIPLWTNSTTLGSSVLSQNGIAVQFPATGTANPTTGFNSSGLDLLASSFNKTFVTAFDQHFRWQAEPVGNNTSSPSAKLNLLFAPGAATPAETGLSLSSKGIFTFAAGQTFPGTGTIIGVTAGTDLTGGGSSGNVTLNLDTSKVPQLNIANSFTGNQTVTGNVSASGSVSGASGSFGGSLTAKQLVSTVSSGTAPLSVNSKTQVPNLNASLLGGLSASSFATLGANSFTGNQKITGNLSSTGQLTSTVGTGTAPLAVSSTTQVANLNASFLGGLSAGSFATLGANAFIGNQTINGNLGIGTTSPTERLDLGNQGNVVIKTDPGDDTTPGNVGYKLVGRTAGGGTNTWVMFTAPVGGGFGVPVNSLSVYQYPPTGAILQRFTILPAQFNQFPPAVTIDGIGNVCIGTSSCDANLYVAGVGAFTDNLYAHRNLIVDGCVQASGSVIGGTCSSDVRLKKNIYPFSSVLDKVVRLQPVSYNWRADEFPQLHFASSRAFGLVAQDVEKVFPEMVSVDTNGFKQVNYSELPYLMLQAIRELKAENEELQEELKTKEAQWDERFRAQEQRASLQEMQQQVAALEARLARVESEGGSNQAGAAPGEVP
jgi:hypothetical protein